MPAYIAHVVQSVWIAKIANQPLSHLQKAQPHIRGSAIRLKGANEYE